MYGVIYKITNLKNNKIYIGQTIKKNPYQRINQHFLGTGNRLLFKSFLKNNKDKKLYKVEIIACSKNSEDLNYCEQFFINYFNCLVPNGYNLDSGGKQHTKSEITKAKLRAGAIRYFQKHPNSRKGKRIPGSTRWLKERRYVRPTIRYSDITAVKLSTNEQYNFTSIAECAKILSLNPTCISRVLNQQNNRTQHKGYTFYSNSGNKTPLPQKPQDPNKYIHKTYNRTKTITYYSVSINGNYIGAFKDLNKAYEVRDSYLKQLFVN